jgi:hypothetical protein
MKKRMQLILVILALIAALSLVTGSVAAKATKTEWTGTSTLGPVIDPGIWTFPDGNVHIRGLVQELYAVVDDPRAGGREIVVANANWDADFAGPIWGTSHVQVDYEGGGVWEGTFTGMNHADGSQSARFEYQGTEGSVRGLKMFGTVERPADPNSPGIATGIILDPHGE